MDSPMEQLAAFIEARTTEVASYFRENRKPQPSFVAGGTSILDIKSPDVEKARREAVNALYELIDLLHGPIECMNPRVICRHDIARRVPKRGHVAIKDLADQCELDVIDLKRIIRFAIAHHRLFTEPEAGFIGHSAGSLMLANDEVLRAGIAQSFEEFYPAFTKTADALDLYKDHEPNHTGYALAHQTDGRNFWEHLNLHPEKVDRFSKAMRCFTAGVPAFSESFLINGYDWKSLGKATVIDAGGSDGHISTALAKVYPQLKFVVQDLAQVIDTIEPQVDVPISHHIDFVAHDFFTPQTLVADVYLFRWVFHDWPDHYVVRILRNLVPALRTGSKIILNESVGLDDIKTLPLAMQRHITSVPSALFEKDILTSESDMDMLMLTMNNSRLRTVPEWQHLFTTADHRFGTVKCSVPEGSALGIMEVTWTA